jgi:hypothetical protein
MTTKQLTRDEAVAFHDEKKWEPMSHRERAEFQMEQDKLCMPFSVFHEAMEKAIGRPVWTHEFAERDRLRAELAGTRKPANFGEVLDSLQRVANGKPVIVIDGGRT